MFKNQDEQERNFAHPHPDLIDERNTGETLVDVSTNPHFVRGAFQSILQKKHQLLHVFIVLSSFFLSPKKTIYRRFW